MAFLLLSFSRASFYCLPQTPFPPLGSCYLQNLLPFKICTFDHSCLCDCPWPNLTLWISAQLYNLIKIWLHFNPSLPYIPSTAHSLTHRDLIRGLSPFLTLILKLSSKPENSPWYKSIWHLHPNWQSEPLPMTAQGFFWVNCAFQSCSI